MPQTQGHRPDAWLRRPPHQASSAIPTLGGRREGRGYHHGNLRRALIDTGAELARTGGPDAVVLRAASRQVGVSPTAAYRHFANQEDLVAAVSQDCMTKLSESMIARKGLVTTWDGVERAATGLEAIGRAYIDFARTEAGWFRTAFSSARRHLADGSAGKAMHPNGCDTKSVPGPHHLLRAGLDEFVEFGALAPERRAGIEYAVWSAVHGLSLLLLDGPPRDMPDTEVEREINFVLTAVCRVLT